MKITNKELLKAIWTNQLRILSRDVLHNYIGGSVNVCCDEDSWYKSESSEHISSRQRVTDKITKKHLLIRLKSLNKKGLIETRYDRGGLFLTFMIENDKSRKAFQAARQFWLDHGVPTGYSKLEDGRSCCNTTSEVDVDSLLPECEKMLLEKFN